MSTTDGAETFEYRTELDRLYQLSRWRAVSKAPEEPQSGWIPSEEAIIKQKKLTDAAARTALDSGSDFGELCDSAVHGTTKGYVAEFLGQLYIDRSETVCVRGATDEIRQAVLSGLFAMMSVNSITVPASSVVGPTDNPTLQTDGGSELALDGSRSIDSTPIVGANAPAEAAATVFELLVDADLEKQHPIVDIADIAQFDTSVSWVHEFTKLVVSGMNATGFGGVIHLPDADELELPDLESLATYTIDLRETDGKIEARVLGADSESLSENWWLLHEA